MITTQIALETIKKGGGMSGQNEPILSEQEIVDILRNIFEHSTISKDELQKLWNRISNNYV